jgi:2-dehydropantoate 2-reductase
VGPGSRVAVLQNGVEHRDRVAPFVGDASVVPAVVYCGAEVRHPGHVVHRTNGFLLVPDDDAGAALAALFEGVGGVEIRPTADWTTAAWTKLCANVVANGVTALTGRRLPVCRSPLVAAEARALGRECVAVARAEGAHVDEAYPDLLVEGMASMPDDSGSSMLYDRLAGRTLEWDAIHGAVLRAAVRHGVDTPRTALLTALLAGASGEDR